jgi:hypothetical protein
LGRLRSRLLGGENAEAVGELDRPGAVVLGHVISMLPRGRVRCRPAAEQFVDWLPKRFTDDVPAGEFDGGEKEVDVRVLDEQKATERFRLERRVPFDHGCDAVFEDGDGRLRRQKHAHLAPTRDSFVRIDANEDAVHVGQFVVIRHVRGNAAVFEVHERNVHGERFDTGDFHGSE